ALFTAPLTPQSYTLSLHDALPISGAVGARVMAPAAAGSVEEAHLAVFQRGDPGQRLDPIAFAFQQLATVLEGLLDDDADAGDLRSEEHTSELQSRENLVCRLLLEK